jgi:hypothetical protein
LQISSSLATMVQEVLASGNDILLQRHVRSRLRALEFGTPIAATVSGHGRAANLTE